MPPPESKKVKDLNLEGPRLPGGKKWVGVPHYRISAAERVRDMVCWLLPRLFVSGGCRSGSHQITCTQSSLPDQTEYLTPEYLNTG